MKQKKSDDEIMNVFKDDGKLLILPEFKKFGLNLRQAKFAQMKAYGYNNTESARAAGYAQGYAYTIGWNLMQDEGVVKYIEYLQANVAYSYGISKNMLVEELVKIKTLAMKDKKYQVAINALKAVANIVGMENGKNPELDKNSIGDDKTVNNFLINFSGNVPEEKRKIMQANNLLVSPEIEKYDEFKNDDIDDRVQDALKREIKNIEEEENLDGEE